MIYYNPTTKKFYYGGAITQRLSNGAVFSGVPSAQKLAEWGYEEYTPAEPTERELALIRMREIEQELKALDYLTSKEADGEDMTVYDTKYGGDWHQYRRNLRIEYNQLESEVNSSETNNIQQEP